jgi:hypothetical protein
MPSASDLDAIGSEEWAPHPQRFFEARYECSPSGTFAIATVPRGFVPSKSRRGYFTMVVSSDAHAAKRALAGVTPLGLALGPTSGSERQLISFQRRAGRLYRKTRAMGENDVVLLVATGVRNGVPLKSTRIAVAPRLPLPGAEAGDELCRTLWAGATTVIIFSELSDSEAERIHGAWQLRPVPMFTVLIVRSTNSSVLADPREEPGRGEFRYEHVGEDGGSSDA